MNIEIDENGKFETEILKNGVIIKHLLEPTQKWKNETPDFAKIITKTEKEQLLDLLKDSDVKNALKQAII